MKDNKIKIISDEVEMHRGKDLEVPLFEVEQRVELIEKKLQSLDVELLDKMTDKVCHKLNMGL